MRKNLLRKPGDPKTAAPAAAGDRPPPAGAAPRRARVRNRLLVSVALCAVAVAGAGAPTVIGAIQDVSDTQDLVDLAGLNKKAVSLSHALADERDGMVVSVAAEDGEAAGTGQQPGVGSSASGDSQAASEAGEPQAGEAAEAAAAERRSRVDRLVHAVRGDEAVPASVKEALGTLPQIRGRAGSGGADARETYEAYSELLAKLRDVSGSVARGLPGRAQDRTADALPDLGLAVEQASAARGLLRGALAASGPQRELVTEARRATVREQAARAGFEDTAGATARDTLASTVTGTDVSRAEKYLERLTDGSSLTPRDRLVDRDRFETSVSARIDRMRGVQASLAAHEVKRLESLRDEDVTDLELLIALAGGCLLVAVGAGVAGARSMARPLAVLRRGSQRLAAAQDDPGAEEPVTFTGRNDEFAEVVRALNTLRGTAAALHERATEAEADNSYLVGTKDELVTERERLRAEVTALQGRLATAQDQLTATREQVEAARERAETASGAVHGTFVNLGLRTLGLVERQLGVIEGLEEKEADPDRLGTLFKLDHLATRMRRHSENLLLLAGAEHAGGNHGGPVPLLDVLRAAVSEIERYERVELGTLPPHVQVAGFAADDVSHLLAELLDNAATFSPPESRVQLSGWLLESGEAMLSVQDDGIGITDERLAELNERLAVPEGMEPPDSHGQGTEFGLGMGLYVVARLASRQHLRVQLRRSQQGGTGGVTAVVTVPQGLLPDRPAPGAARADGGRETAGGGGAQMQPGSVAEANSNTLPNRRAPHRSAGTVPEPDAAAAGLTGATESAPEGAAVPGARSAPEAEPAAVIPAGGDRFVAAAEEAVRKAEREAVSERGEPAEQREPEEQHQRETEHGPGWGHRHDTPDPYGAATGQGAGDAANSGNSGNDVRDEQEAGDVHDDRAAAAVTEKGLPKRHPKQVAAQAGLARPRKGGANAEELRRRLGGFQQGAQNGRREAEAETAGRGIAADPLHDQSGAQVNGGTAEEARK